MNNYHFRSFSEQPAHQAPTSFLNNQPLASPLLPNNMNGALSTNGIDANDTNNNTLIEAAPTNGIIRIHSDSQQSLDRLFNPAPSETNLPLRHRNLPASFFNPSWKSDPKDAEHTTNGFRQNNLHSRSTSFDLRRPEHTNGFNRVSLHTRTQSTIVPMTIHSGGQTPSSITGSTGSLGSLQSTSSSALTSNNSSTATNGTPYQAQHQQYIQQPQPQQQTQPIPQTQPLQPQPQPVQQQFQPQQHAPIQQQQHYQHHQQAQPQHQLQQQHHHHHHPHQHHHHQHRSNQQQQQPVWTYQQMNQGAFVPSMMPEQLVPGTVHVVSSTNPGLVAGQTLVVNGTSTTVHQQQQPVVQQRVTMHHQPQQIHSQPIEDQMYYDTSFY